MRCVCCDFSPDLPSVLQTSLPESPKKLRDFKGEYYCDVCFGHVKDTMQGFNLEVEAETEAEVVVDTDDVALYEDT